MAFYESTFIARQDISAQDAEKLAENFSAVVKENGGSVVKTEYWGLRSLAYKINKGKKGHYFMLGIDAPAKAVNEIDRKARLSEDIIRNLNVRVEAISSEDSAILNEANGSE